MAIENIMYFALGFLIATLFAIIVLPSVWKRAVRLTKKRIEAATPITMAEFRADKDQLRAEFALTSRRLERNIETLRTQLTEQLSELTTAKSALAIAIAERDRHAAENTDLEQRNNVATERLHQLEKQFADLAQNLRTREREISDLKARLETGAPPEKTTRTAIASIKQALSFGEKDTFDALDSINEAYSRISSAGSNLDALLEEDALPGDKDTGKALSLAEKLSQEDALEDLRHQILDVENIIHSDWQSGKAGKSDLRERLGEIASSVSQLVYATDSDTPRDAEESLFDRIRKFAGDSLEAEELSAQSSSPHAKDALQPVAGTSLSERIAAFQDIHANN